MNLRRITPKEKEAQDFKPKDRVAYIPNHAHGDIQHKDVLWGYVSSINNSYVFVRFDAQIKNLGWNEATSQSCLPQNLVNFGFSNEWLGTNKESRSSESSEQSEESSSSEEKFITGH